MADVTNTAKMPACVKLARLRNQVAHLKDAIKEKEDRIALLELEMKDYE